VLAIVVGAFLYAYIIGDFSNLLANLSKERSDFDEKMRAVNDLLAYIDCPADVRTKVQDYYDFKFQNKEGKAGLDRGLQSLFERALDSHIQLLWRVYLWS
jgi:hypothetical protein